MIQNEKDLLEKLSSITDELGGKMERLTTYASTGKQSKKIVIEYDEVLQPRK